MFNQASTYSIPSLHPFPCHIQTSLLGHCAVTPTVCGQDDNNLGLAGLHGETHKAVLTGLASVCTQSTLRQTSHSRVQARPSGMSGVFQPTSAESFGHNRAPLAEAPLALGEPLSDRLCPTVLVTRLLPCTARPLCDVNHTTVSVGMHGHTEAGRSFLSLMPLPLLLLLLLLYLWLLRRLCVDVVVVVWVVLRCFVGSMRCGV